MATRYFPIDRRRRICVITLIVFIWVAAFALRWGTANGSNISRDEAFTWRLIQYDSAEVIRRTAADSHPPLYYLVLKSFASVFGSSIDDLRTMSVILGAATAPLAYFAALAAIRFGNEFKTRARIRSAYVSPTGARVLRYTEVEDGEQAAVINGPAEMHWQYVAALSSAAFVACHGAQVDAAGAARMYSLGVFFTVLSTWLLITALCADRYRLGWSIAYGISAALFCYTHNYAIFTTAAQLTCLAAAAVWRLRNASRSVAIATFFQFLAAAATVAVIYGPWTPILLRQYRDVAANYWVRSLSWDSVSNVLFYWITGLTRPGLAEQLLSAAILVSVTAWAFRRFDWGVAAFAVMAVFPWACCITLSLLCDKTVLHSRYLVFAQASWVILCGLLIGRIQRPKISISVALTLSTMLVCATCYDRPIPPRPRAALIDVFEFIRDHEKEDDVVVLHTWKEVNRMRYYAQLVGTSDIGIQCRSSSLGSAGHEEHLAALKESDIIRPNEWPLAVDRMWYLFEADDQMAAPPVGMELVLSKNFFQDGRLSYVLLLYTSGEAERQSR